MKRDHPLSILRGNPCSVVRNFKVSDTGVISGRFEEAAGKSGIYLSVRLIRLHDESGSEVGYIKDPKPGTDFTFEHLPPGRYLVHIYVMDRDGNVTTGFYHPGTRTQKDAQVIHLGEDRKVHGLAVNLTLPEDR